MKFKVLLVSLFIALISINAFAERFILRTLAYEDTYFDGDPLFRSIVNERLVYGDGECDTFEKSNPQDMPQDGLIMYFTFDKLENGVFEDKSGNGHQAVPVDTNLLLGRFCNAVEFPRDGDTAAVDIADTTQRTSQLSVSLWYFPYELLDFDAVGDPESHYLFDFRYDPSAGYYVPQWQPVNILLINQFASDVETDFIQESNQWLHIVSVFEEPSTMDVYVNGYLVIHDTESELLQDAGNFGVTIGNRNKNEREAFQILGVPLDPFDAEGLIDDFRVYNRKLTKEEIKTLYSMKRTY